ncbi:hypothetical protein SLS62_011040 [Diatrype stigma]|uniref:Uncharacterized protein n=1 Tax=Diatrype stigma TaxID=117547 RepID=A0AAN9U6G9_9PEZI
MVELAVEQDKAAQALRKQRHDLLQEQENLKTKHDSILQEKDQECQDLRKSYLAKREEYKVKIANRETALQALQKETNALQDDRNKKAQAHKQATIRSEDLERAKSANEEMQGLLQVQKNLAEEQLTMAREKNETLKTDKEYHEKRKGEYKNAMYKLLEEKKKLGTDKTDLQRDIQRLENNISGSDLAVATAKHDLKMAKHEVKELGKQKAALQTSLQEAKASSDDAIENLQSTVSAKDKEIAQLQKDLGELRRDATSAQQEKEALEAEKDGTIRVLAQQIGQLHGTIRDQKREIATLQGHTSWLRRDVESVQAQSRAGTLRAAQAFALEHDSQHGPERWLPFAEAFHDTEVVPGGPLADGDLPWVILPPWGGNEAPSTASLGETEESGGSGSGSGSSSGLVYGLHRMYAAALSGLPVPETWPRLQRLVEELAQVSEAPPGLISVTLQTCMDVLEVCSLQTPEGPDGPDGPEAPDRALLLRLLTFGVWQAIRLGKMRWGVLSAAAGRVETMLEAAEGQVALLFRRFEADNGAQLTTDLLASQGPGATDSSMLFSPSAGTGLWKLEPSKWVWIVQPAHRTIRLAHCQRGAWHGSTSAYKIRGNIQEEDLVIPLEHVSDPVWILDNMWQR